jgi:GNAT superfamily N-acetyltransferase
MTNLEIRFLRQAEISPELQNEIDAVDHLAFHFESNEDDNDTNDAGKFEIRWQDIRWGPLEWMALGYVGDELVTILGLLRREILVGGEPLWVVGVGGVATHPAWQKRGLSTRLLQASETFMREKLSAPFGLLVCGEDRLAFYKRVGWKHVADKLFFLQDGRRYPLVDIPVMILPLSERDWLPGEIDLCGSPW